MIPWRIRFSGIRDYTPTVMDFSDKDDHILISGPNGAGKSTVTFCMGGVLYSSKVDVEGLKSNNLPTGQTWRAKIELLFKNDGKVKMDAPLFVQFRLDVEQKPGEPVKKEFYIEEGDTIDQWERSTKFSSGGNLNFTEYKNQVLYKYAVDPDAFYLIWYQKEVNQFAVMHPEERFRIFSEMNGIDKIQKNWEESKELVKETERSLQEAESKQGLNKLQLKQKKTELDRYYDRNRRLEESFKEYGTALKWLEHYHLQQIDQLKGQIGELTETKQETVDNIKDLEMEHIDQQEQQRVFQKNLAELNERNQALEQELAQLNQQLKDRQEKREAISNEIVEITRKVDRIGMSKEEVEQTLAEAEERANRLSSSIREKEQQARELWDKVNKQVNQHIAALHQEIKQDETQLKRVRDLIETYHSSNVVQTEMDENDRKLDKHKNRVLELKNKRQALEKELGYLKKNQVISPRQESSITYFKQRNIDVYPLRELLELDETAKPNDELLFETIKYTLFVNKKHFQAPNDLYHVPLPDIVPDKLISHLQDKHIKVKNGLADDHYAFAVKALWWTRSFFEAEEPVIRQGSLVDRRGVRGPQEAKKIILSEKMLKKHREEIQKEFTVTQDTIDNLQDTIKALNEKNTVLFKRREALKDAEAVLTQENDRELRKEKYRKLVAQRDELFDEQAHIQSELNEKNTSLAECNQKVSTYRAYRATYLLYEQEQEKIAEVQRLDQAIKELKNNKQTKNKQLSELSNLLDKQTREERQLIRHIEDLADRLNARVREVDQLKRQIEDRSEERVTSEESYIATHRELQQLRVSAAYPLEESLPEITRSKAEEMRERGKTIYDHAVHESGIDEAAPENYSKMKEEYERSANEVKKSTMLLEEHRERMERFKEDLEDTINMKMIGVNQKFVHYMSLFGFEGKIEWDYIVNRHGQTRYKLYIKARKEGHRGRLEDVSEKARGGKVGKGVSGGEESLSSLLFALALLQTIEASPGYIVLDEFDSALDEGRKDKVFELYEQELNRKMIILTPKSHEEEYLYRFSKAYVVHHNPNVPKSTVFKVKRKTRQYISNVE
ncbi:AAA family ATPase [Gracilibacillus alcaliphilus]|uniref:AAA family ATPase n=1 Tax=Gracilibacillus alcaliphilus TaxID=1401441 RepID=UPI001958EE5A|nr:AAA family ATPase [Gracilibacillus alcaliphilus]MBM7677609.1 chromosome segregation protein [Gracilibacillus alcaliphilus]